MTERMGPTTAVFNSHVNDARDRADAEFIAQFGPQRFEQVMAPIHEAGLMSIFDGEPTVYTMAWLTLCRAYVNEGVAA